MPKSQGVSCKQLTAFQKKIEFLTDQRKEPTKLHSCAASKVKIKGKRSAQMNKICDEGKMFHKIKIGHQTDEPFSVSIIYALVDKCGIKPKSIKKINLDKKGWKQSAACSLST